MARSNGSGKARREGCGTVSHYARVTLYCNNVDKDAPVGRRTCREQFTGDATQNVAAVRAEARKQGWAVNVPWFKGAPRGTGRDFCPAHKQAAKEQSQ